MGFAIASLILGLVGFVLSLFLIGALLGLAGVILGILHLRRKDAPALMAGFGTGLGILALLASAGMGFFYYKVYQEFQEIWGGDFGYFDTDDWEGVTAPDIAVRTLDGETLVLSELRGQRVVLNFWATWCPPCVREIPHFVQLSGEIPSDQLLIIGISDEEQSVVERFARRQGINYPLGSMVDEHPVSPYGDIRSIPTTFFIDRNGVIQTVRKGYLSLDEMRGLALAEDWAGEPRPAPDTDWDFRDDDGIPLLPPGLEENPPD